MPDLLIRSLQVFQVVLVGCSFMVLAPEEVGHLFPTRAREQGTEGAGRVCTCVSRHCGSARWSHLG